MPVGIQQCGNNSWQWRKAGIRMAHKSNAVIFTFLFWFWLSAPPQVRYGCPEVEMSVVKPLNWALVSERAAQGKQMSAGKWYENKQKGKAKQKDKGASEISSTQNRYAEFNSCRLLTARELKWQNSSSAYIKWCGGTDRNHATANSAPMMGS